MPFFRSLLSLTALASACHASVLLSTGASFTNASTNASSTAFLSTPSTSLVAQNSTLTTSLTSSVVSLSNITTTLSSSSIVPPLSTGNSPSSSTSIPLGTGVSSSSSSVPLGTGVSSSSSSIPLGTGVSSSSSSVPLGTGASSSSSSLSATGSSSATSSGTLTTATSGTTGTSSNTSPDPTPISSAIPTVVIPTTTVTGAAETSAAVQIGPLLSYLWQNRDWINDDDNKQTYIDNVEDVDNNISSLLDDIPNPPSPPSECGSIPTKKRSIDGRHLRKRSIISSILGELSDVATAISCASEITGNLVNAVKSSTIDIATVDDLTDALKDISDKLNEDEEESSTTSSQTSTSSAPSSSSSSQSCTSSSAVTSCTDTALVSTLFNTVSGTTSSSVTTITTSSCTTVTACDATGTTVLTTTSTASTTGTSDYTPCAYQCLQSTACGYPSGSATGAARKRAAQPTPDSASSFAKRALPNLVSEELAKRTLQATGSISNYADYVNQKAQGSGELDWGFINFQAVSADYTFGSTATNNWMQGVLGCTSIIITSAKGFWWSHLMEPGFIGSTDAQVTNWNSIVNALTNGDAKTTTPSSLAAAGGILEPSDDNPITIYVFSPSAAEQYDDDWEPLPTTGKYQAKIDTLLGLLKTNDGAPFPDATQSVSYYEWPNESVASEAVGKLVFEYDPEGTTDDTCQAVYRLWLNDKPTQVSFTAPGANSKAKRQACSISSSASSSGTSSASSTSGSSSVASSSTGVVSTTSTSANTTSASATSSSSAAASSTSASSTTAASTTASSTSAASTSASSSSVSSTSASPSPTSTTLSTVTTSSSAPASSTTDATSTLPYSPVGSTGPDQNNRCHVHVWEYDLTTEGDTLVAQIQIWDAAGNQILAPTEEQTISDNGGYHWNCSLQEGLTVTGDAQTDTVSFETNVAVWDSSSTAAESIDLYCNTGGWATDNPDEKERQMDCYFHCPWVYPNGTVYPAADTLHNP